jgi:hypothetical protein
MRESDAGASDASAIIAEARIGAVMCSGLSLGPELALSLLWIDSEEAP